MGKDMRDVITKLVNHSVNEVLTHMRAEHVAQSGERRRELRAVLQDLRNPVKEDNGKLYALTQATSWSPIR